MSLYQRGDIWWVKLYQDGIPLYKSTRTPDAQAPHLADKILSSRSALVGLRQATSCETSRRCLPGRDGAHVIPDPAVRPGWSSALRAP